MGRSLSYYGVSVDDYEYRSQLVRDMVETWGQDLSAINSKTTLLLISALATFSAENDNTPIDPNLSEVLSRFDELTQHDMLCLIQALAN
jgi:hypothetical protein